MTRLTMISIGLSALLFSTGGISAQQIKPSAIQPAPIIDASKMRIEGPLKELFAESKSAKQDEGKNDIEMPLKGVVASSAPPAGEDESKRKIEFPVETIVATSNSDSQSEVVKMESIKFLSKTMIEAPVGSLVRRTNETQQDEEARKTKQRLPEVGEASGARKLDDSNDGEDNPAVQPGLVNWHPDFETACSASKKSGKPVLLFHLLGKLDQRFT